jgi:hypothetical protein
MREMNRWQKTRSLVACVGMGLALGAFATRAGAAPQTQSRTETKSFEVISVDGNKVVIRDAQGAREVTVPNDFTVDVAGKKVGVHELKPGMKGTATITTTMTEHKVYVTEVKEARVHQVVGGNIIVMIKGETSYRMFTQTDATKQGRTVLQNGRPLDWQTLRVGNIITATIVTEGPPQVLTEKQVEVKMAEAAKAAATAPPPAMATSSAPPAGGSSAGVTSAPASTPAATATPAAAAPAPASTPAAAPSGAGATEPPAAPNAIPATAATTPPAEETGWNPLLIGGIAIVLIVALVMFLAMRRKDEEKAH